MIFVFYFFASILTFLGYKSLRGGIDYLNYFKRELAKPESNFTPFCSIIVPCRGVDEGLQANLIALFEQDFPQFEIIFAVDDEKDESVKFIEEVSRKGAKNAKLIIAGKAGNEGQKVHNLRRAVLEVADESEIFVFVDSDARPGESWLRNLIAPLQDKNIGAATGYRWFIEQKNTFSTQLRSVWNASIASALGAKTNNNFCWGGSTAIRRETFEKLDMYEKWRGTLSDDFTVTRAMKEANLPIYFVPQALTASVEDCIFSEFLEFTTRQMKITRVYAPHLWKATFIGSFLFTAISATGVILLFFLSGWQFWLTLTFLSVIFALGTAKAWIRLKAVKLILKNYEKELNESFLWQATLWVITPAVYFYNCLCAFFSNQIRWRGITYKLKSPTDTVVLPSDKKIVDFKQADKKF
ncbi:MAG: glycosyltransferase [Pyrinomonadaceae bacterium]